MSQLNVDKIISEALRHLENLEDMEDYGEVDYSDRETQTALVRADIEIST